MKSFRFRLQRVLDWQRQQCDAALAELNECTQAVQQSRSRLARHTAECLKAQRQVIHSGVPTPADLSALAYYRVRAAKLELQFQAAIATAEERLARQQQEMIRLRRRFRLLEKLRDRDAEAYELAASREMENQASDTFLAKWKVPEVSDGDTSARYQTPGAWSAPRKPVPPPPSGV